MTDFTFWHASRVWVSDSNDYVSVSSDTEKSAVKRSSNSTVVLSVFVSCGVESEDNVMTRSISMRNSFANNAGNLSGYARDSAIGTYCTLKRSVR